jgi:tRNA (guanosine-2'-O-)-methyltransferase
VRADDPDVFEIEGPPPLDHPADVVIAALSPVVTEERLRRIEEVVAGRTDSLAIVLDRLSDPHNSSAVLRSAEAFGIQHVCAVVGRHGFRASHGVSKGTQRWLDVTRFENAAACARALKERGFAMYAAAMDGTHTLEELRSVPQLAVVFGNEHHGVSDAMRAHADGTFAIPMRGFVESLNVSVAAAITMQTLTGECRPPLSDARRRELLARFLMNSVKNADEIIAKSIGNE